MSKVFEKEYKKLAQSELPDLWDRIEAGLSEKKPFLTTEHETSADEISMTVSIPIMIDEAVNHEINKAINTKTDNKTKKRSVLVFFRRYQTVAAALLCVMILVPAFLLMRQIGGGMSESSADTVTEAAPAEEKAVSEAAAEEPMETETAAGAEEEFIAEGAPAEEAAAETEAAAEAEAAEELYADTEASRNALAEKAETETATEDKMSQQKQYAENKAEENVLYRVSVEILQKQEEDNLAESEALSGSLYKCVVLGGDEDGQLAGQEEITVLVPMLIAEELTEGETYELDLTESDSEYYDYVAESLYY